MTDKKASDYLISIEAKLDKLLAESSNNKLQLNILLNKLNKITSNITVTDFVKEKLTDVSDFVFTPASDDDKSEPIKKVMPGLKSNVEIQDGVLIQRGEESLKENLNSHILLKPVPVTQKILYPDFSGVFNATVSIFDSNKNKIKTLKTNNGKWNSALMPGKYNIIITKTATHIKPEIKFNIDVVIPSSDNVIELPTQQDNGDQ